MIYIRRLFMMIAAILITVSSGAIGAVADEQATTVERDDRLWTISSRQITSDAYLANVESPDLSVTRLDPIGNRQSTSLDDFFAQLEPGRPVVLHVHGNRLTECEAIARGLFVYRNVTPCLPYPAIDFLVFTWPSERLGLPIRDGRRKAQMTEAEGLYLAWFLRELVQRDLSVTVIGYSFGARVVTGALHTLAGGHLSGRRLPGPTIRGAELAVGLVAPALEANWLDRGQYHGLASQNMSDLAVLYNSKDAILKRYWLITSATRGGALGYSGPKRIALGYDGQRVPLVMRDCARFLGIGHSEIDYYARGCRIGPTLARLIHGASPVASPNPLPADSSDDSTTR